jgi:glutamyl/glutaminyl-tRNA synthetase
VRAIGALIKACIAKHGLKMPKFAMPLRILLTGQEQTPSVDAVVALFPRETRAQAAGCGGRWQRLVLIFDRSRSS